MIPPIRTGAVYSTLNHCLAKLRNLRSCRVGFLTVVMTGVHCRNVVSRHVIFSLTISDLGEHYHRILRWRTAPLLV